MTHVEKAKELFERNFHCSQAILAAFSEELGLTQADELDINSQLKTNEVTDKFLDEFQKENGSYMCKELLGCDLSTEEGILSSTNW